MKKICICLSLLLCVLSFGGCTAREPRATSFFIMDTVITVSLYGVSEEEAQPIFAQCRQILEELDALWARNREGSDLFRINAAEAGVIPLDARTVSLLELSRRVQAETGDAFDVSLAPLCDLWNACGTENRLPTSEELTDLLSHTGADKWTLHPNGVEKHDARLSLDVGGIGKGAAADAVLAYLNTTQASGGMVSFGSNVAVFGEKPDGSDFRIGVRDPKNTQGMLGTLSLSVGQALSVSGDYERFVTVGGEIYHHILDSKTGYPSQSGLSSVAVVCESGALADALSTACLVLGYEGAMELYSTSSYRFEAVFVFSNGEVTVTQGLLPQWSAV